MRFQRWVALGALCVLLSACTHTVSNLATQASINWTPEKNKRVVIIEPDVVLSELTAGGVTEARADWTQTGKEYIESGIGSLLASKNIDAVSSGDINDPRENQLIKLHGAVGVAIMQNSLLNLPTKGKNFDWTLGPGASTLRDQYHCDYALFVFVRDSYSSAGRMAIIALGAIAGVGIPGGQQLGFASLVDLRTGQIVWFNRLASSNGSLKDAKGANATVASLLDGLPL